MKKEQLVNKLMEMCQRIAELEISEAEHKQVEEALHALLLADELTGLYNRRGFFNLAEQQLRMAERTKRKMLLLFADFDDLKWINDTFGHAEGDRALIQVAGILRETFRESDIIARIGGDEFVVLAMETDGASAEILTTRLQKNLETHNAKGPRRYKLSLSVGVARYDPEHPCSIDELLARADKSMYEHKQNNRMSWLKVGRRPIPFAKLRESVLAVALKNAPMRLGWLQRRSHGAPQDTRC
jgi:diguanylate cyclase (GGDEF)-like protein